MKNKYLKLILQSNQQYRRDFKNCNFAWVLVDDINLQFTLSKSKLQRLRKSINSKYNDRQIYCIAKDKKNNSYKVFKKQIKGTDTATATISYLQDLSNMAFSYLEAYKEITETEIDNLKARNKHLERLAFISKGEADEEEY